LRRPPHFDTTKTKRGKPSPGTGRDRKGRRIFTPFGFTVVNFSGFAAPSQFQHANARFSVDPTDRAAGKENRQAEGCLQPVTVWRAVVARAPVKVLEFRSRIVGPPSLSASVLQWMSKVKSLAFQNMDRVLDLARQRFPKRIERFQRHHPLGEMLCRSFAPEPGPSALYSQA